LTRVEVIVALGGFAWDAVLRAVRLRSGARISPKPAVGHGAEVALHEVTLLGSYHPSQQNTFTGRLTEAMLDSVFQRAREICKP
jgi:uracil-DNA glycosylase